MKGKLLMTICAAGLFLLLATLSTLPTGTAGNQQETQNATVALSSDDSDLLFAGVDQADNPGYNLQSAYAELKDLGKKYRKARERDARQRILTRAEELLEQIFDAKVQKEEQRIQALEKRLNQEKERLHDMQLHKMDLIHNGVQKALDQGELPDWASEK